MAMRIAKAAGLAAILMAAPAVAQSGWSMIGYRDVGPEADHDTITVRVEEQHQQLMFCTERHAIRIIDGIVHYRDGRSQNVRVRTRLEADRCGRSIDLSGRNKDVATMDFTYEVASLAGAQARVQLYAR
jgi:hypothetical protein